jgi:hypothetical protein
VLIYSEKNLGGGHYSVKYFDHDDKPVTIGKVLNTKTLAGTSMPPSAFGTGTQSACSVILNPGSVTSEGAMGSIIPGWATGTVELSPKGRRLGNHVEPFFFSAFNIHRGGIIFFIFKSIQLTKIFKEVSRDG